MVYPLPYCRNMAAKHTYNKIQTTSDLSYCVKHFFTIIQDYKYLIKIYTFKLLVNCDKFAKKEENNCKRVTRNPDAYHHCQDMYSF